MPARASCRRRHSAASPSSRRKSVRSSRPPARLDRQSGNSTGIFAASRIGSPMSTRTRSARPSTISRSSESTPLPVSIFNVGLRPGRDRGHTWRRSGLPLPHISDSDPSALNIRIRASATVRRADQNQPVAADAEMPIGDPRGPGPPGRPALAGEAIDIDVVVAGPLHLGKPHDGNPLGWETNRAGEFYGIGAAAANPIGRRTTRVRRGRPHRRLSLPRNVAPCCRTQVAFRSRESFAVCQAKPPLSRSDPIDCRSRRWRPC